MKKFNRSPWILSSLLIVIFLGAVSFYVYNQIQPSGQAQVLSNLVDTLEAATDHRQRVAILRELSLQNLELRKKGFYISLNDSFASKHLSTLEECQGFVAEIVHLSQLYESEAYPEEIWADLFGDSLIESYRNFLNGGCTRFL